MAISVVRPASGLGQRSTRAREAGEPQAPAKILPRQILYRGLLWTLLACVVCAGIGAKAQEERPQLTPGERKVPRKKDAGPRALAGLQMSANGKVSLVPVAILINGKFWDASAYKANPVPMALDSGTVYEGERAGSSVGLFTVGSALHSLATNAPIPWIGTGAWLPEGKEVPNKPMKAEITPVGIGSSDDPPRLTKPGLSPSDKSASEKPAGDKPATDKTASPATPASSTNPSASTPPTQPSADEPPRLKRPPSSGSGDSGSAQPNSGSSTTQSAPTSSSPSSPDAKPTDTKPDDAKASDKKSIEVAADQPAAPPPPASDSGAASGYRPRLRRGKPATSFADEDIPGYSKPGVTPSAAAKAAAAKSAAAAQEIVDLVPAISDASSNDLHAFSFVWLKDEEGERHKQIEGIAKQEVISYLTAQAKATTTPTPASAKTGAKTGARTAAKKFPEPILENMRMVAYDLWGNNIPVIVFSADAHLPPPPAGSAHSDVEAEIQYSVTLVMRPDIYDTLRKLYVGVTDKNHLDITPRLQLIDAVDADGDGRGELLFKETSDAGAGWIVYRANADKLWKMFDSFSPE